MSTEHCGLFLGGALPSHGQKKGPDVLTSGPNLFEVCFEEGRDTQDICG